MPTLIPQGENWHEEPNEDRTWADISIEYLDGIVQEYGPFYGMKPNITRVPMATVYIANFNTSFEKAFLFNGYLPTTHSGLIGLTINECPILDVDANYFRLTETMMYPFRTRRCL